MKKSALTINSFLNLRLFSIAIFFAIYFLLFISDIYLLADTGYLFFETLAQKSVDLQAYRFPGPILQLPTTLIQKYTDNLSLLVKMLGGTFTFIPFIVLLVGHYKLKDDIRFLSFMLALLFTGILTHVGSDRSLICYLFLISILPWGKKGILFFYMTLLFAHQTAALFIPYLIFAKMQKNPHRFSIKTLCKQWYIILILSLFLIIALQSDTHNTFIAFLSQSDFYWIRRFSLTLTPILLISLYLNLKKKQWSLYFHITLCSLITILGFTFSYYDPYLAFSFKTIYPFILIPFEPVISGAFKLKNNPRMPIAISFFVLIGFFAHALFYSIQSRNTYDILSKFLHNSESNCIEINDIKNHFDDNYNPFHIRQVFHSWALPYAIIMKRGKWEIEQIINTDPMHSCEDLLKLRTPQKGPYTAYFKSGSFILKLK